VRLEIPVLPDNRVVMKAVGRKTGRMGAETVRLYPIMMSLEGKRVIVIGGGAVAERKVTGLLETGALVSVISPELGPRLRELASKGGVDWIAEEFHPSLLDRFNEITLIFGATNNPQVNLMIHEAATKRKILCNIADVPDLCTFIVPAVITQGELMIAVTTGGSSPALARRIREDLERRFGPEYAELTKVLGELRKLVLSAGGPSNENRKLFMEIVDSELLVALRENDRNKVLAILRAILPDYIDPQAAVEENPRSSPSEG
jgi:precorrin-2 dehydrogenase/sirohydrochlorin ferrochelatase